MMQSYYFTGVDVMGDASLCEIADIHDIVNSGIPIDPETERELELVMIELSNGDIVNYQDSVTLDVYLFKGRDGQEIECNVQDIINGGTPIDGEDGEELPLIGMIEPDGKKFYF